MSIRPSSTSLRTTILVFAILAPLAAQETPDASGFSKALKIRMAYGLKTEDHLRPASIGLGFNVAYGSAAGSFGVEMGYYYKTGDQYIEPIQGSAPAPLSAVNPDKSGDSRRNQLDGFALRFSFQRAINEDWGWHAGVMLGGTRFTHEYVGDVEGANWTSANANSWRDTYSGTPVEGGMKPSPYAGVSMKVTSISSLELNLMLLNYKAINYVHRPGTAAPVNGTTNPYPIPSDTTSNPGGLSGHNAFPGDELEKKSRLVPHLELAYVFRF
jgi:hypothetical protein